MKKAVYKATIKNFRISSVPYITLTDIRVFLIVNFIKRHLPPYLCGTKNRIPAVSEDSLQNLPL